MAISDADLADGVRQLHAMTGELAALANRQTETERNLHVID